MSDLETGLKEAVAEAAAQDWNKNRNRAIAASLADIRASPREVYAGRSQEGTGMYVGNTRKAAMTGPEVIQAIENLEKRADEIQAIARDLADTLAGPDYANMSNAKEPEPPTSIFDRMGVELMLLTRTLTAIEADVRRALGAVKP